MSAQLLDRSKVPHKSGVYIFKDERGNKLYIGKAINLYHRIASYFSGVSASRQDLSKRTNLLVSRIRGVETMVVESELEALILEANLIKRYKPPFNIRLTDDKDYLYIGVTGGGYAAKEDFPKIITARKSQLNQLKKYWGPFPSSRTVRDTLKLLRRVFPWCSNPPKENEIVTSTSSPRNDVIASGAKQSRPRFRACFYFHIGLCPGACVGLASREEYSKIIKRFSRFLDGKKEELVEDLTKEMMKASSNQLFEGALKIKKMIDGINYITQTNRVALYLQNPNFLEDERRLALEQLKKDLNLLKLPERIEGYDISNIQGKDAAGSMVVLTNGEIDKSQYRKFKIHMSGRPNDVGMHKEMMKRRLKHLEWLLPDLIIIDGGRGQVRGVASILLAANYKLPIYGLAKKMEWLYPPVGEILKLSKKSLSLKLLQKLRDESHRFAINYHRKLRDTIN